MEAVPRTAPSPPSAASAPLTAAIARGDREAIGRFHDLWYDRVHALAHRLLRERRDELPDVAQEVMLRVVQSLPPLADDRAVAAWMARTVYSVVIDRTRARLSRRRHETAAATQVDAADRSSGFDPEFAEQLQWLRAELRRLPELDRRLLLERYASDVTLAQLGASEGLSGNAASGRLRRALNQLTAAARRNFDD